MKIIFSRDEVAKILTDYIETMIDVKVIDVSKYLDDMTFQCEKNEFSPVDESVSDFDPLPFIKTKAAGLTD